MHGACDTTEEPSKTHMPGDDHRMRSWWSSTELNGHISQIPSAKDGDHGSGANLHFVIFAISVFLFQIAVKSEWWTCGRRCIMQPIVVSIAPSQFVSGSCCQRIGWISSINSSFGIKKTIFTPSLSTKILRIDSFVKFVVAVKSWSRTCPPYLHKNQNQPRCTVRHAVLSEDDFTHIPTRFETMPRRVRLANNK